MTPVPKIDCFTFRLKEDGTGAVLCEPITFTDVNFDPQEVPVGYQTDFASVPVLFQIFIPKQGRYSLASIAHDWLCDLASQKKYSRKVADLTFLNFMRLCGVSFPRRVIMYLAVRLWALISLQWS